jgi:hypothetical protein
VLNSIDLSFRQRIAILIGLLLISLAGLLFVDPIPQDLDYHRLADVRAFFGIPNFNDVMSNTGFALVGILGVIAVVGVSRHTLFVKPIDARPYLIFFAGVALVSLGSAWYHWAPSNERLLWDRLPMSVAFMAFASAIIADRIHARAGNTWLLPVLIILGLSSLLYWHYTEQLGRGDLRFYAFVQFYPVIILPVILWLFPEYRYVPGRYIAWVFAWYGLSKVLEYFDDQVFGMLGYTISGHTLKHLAAAASALVVLKMLSSRLPSHSLRRKLHNERGGPIT